MNNISRWTLTEIFFASAMLIFVLFLQGAIPFYMMSTLPQALWTTGFATSFAHGSWLTIHAHDFGIPKPAAIAFGLSGALPISLLLRLGLAGADAYAMVTLCWISVAFFSAYNIARTFGNTRYTALLGAVTWMSMPIIWNHAGYGMLSMGICLLSFYFLAAMKLFLIQSKKIKPSLSDIVLYFSVTLVSVFMDGYTFMMFFVGATILLFFTIKIRVDLRATMKKVILPAHFMSFIIAYILYALFIGRSHYDKAPIDFFRGWGLDISFITIPTKGVHWFADVLGLSVSRSGALYFGDASVWITTFSLPIIIAGITAWFFMRKKNKIATSVFVVALFGFYMSLGPSLKINATRPVVTSEAANSQLMPANLATIPTGDAWILKTLPGFNNMRAAYRWAALYMFACWWLVIISISHTERKLIWNFILIGLILLNLPDLDKKMHKDIGWRNMFFAIDLTLVPLLKQYIKQNEVVAFLPWGNDFFVNYLAPTAGFRSFNIGGDKNLADAKTQWPAEMLASGGGPLTNEKIAAGVKMLTDKTADVLVLPYFDLLWSAHIWPCGKEQQIVSDDIYACLASSKENVRRFAEALTVLPNIRIENTALFTTVRLKKISSPENNKNRET